MYNEIYHKHTIAANNMGGPLIGLEG